MLSLRRPSPEDVARALRVARLAYPLTRRAQRRFGRDALERMRLAVAES